MISLVASFEVSADKPIDSLTLTTFVLASPSEMDNDTDSSNDTEMCFIRPIESLMPTDSVTCFVAFFDVDTSSSTLSSRDTIFV